MAGSVPGRPFIGKSDCSIYRSPRILATLSYQLSQLLRFVWFEILPKSRMKPPSCLDFFAGHSRHDAYQLDVGTRCALHG